MRTRSGTSRIRPSLDLIRMSAMRGRPNGPRRAAEPARFELRLLTLSSLLGWSSVSDRLRAWGPVLSRADGARQLPSGRWTRRSWHVKPSRFHHDERGLQNPGPYWSSQLDYVTDGARRQFTVNHIISDT